MNPENRVAHSVAASQWLSLRESSPLLVGDAIHVLNHTVYQALVMKDREVIANLVSKQMAAGAQALSVNLGPGKEMGRLTAWAVDIIRENTDAPLFFSAGILSQHKVMQNYGRCIAINAVTANHEELVRALTAAQEYGSSLVVLLVQSGKATVSLDDRIHLASEVLEQALLKGFPSSRLYLDPVLSCRPDPAAWHVSHGLPDIGSAVETVNLIKQLDTSVKTIVALGNGSEGTAKEQRSGSHCRMLNVLVEAGLDAVLLNCFDTRVMRAAQTLRSGRKSPCNVEFGMMQTSSAA